jgi:hypothetical protein
MTSGFGSKELEGWLDHLLSSETEMETVEWLLGTAFVSSDVDLWSGSHISTHDAFTWVEGLRVRGRVFCCSQPRDDR